MKSLFDPDVIAEIKARIAALRPDSQRRWGRMTPHQAVCHLADAFRPVFGERPTAYTAGPLMRFGTRLFALTLPAPWPKGVATAPEVDQERGGSSPTEFATDAL